MSAVIAGAVLYLACYGLLTIVSEFLARLIGRRLRQFGHDAIGCDICSGRQLREHQRQIVRDARI